MKTRRQNYSPGSPTKKSPGATKNKTPASKVRSEKKSNFTQIIEKSGVRRSTRFRKNDDSILTEVKSKVNDNVEKNLASSSKGRRTRSAGTRCKTIKSPENKRNIKKHKNKKDYIQQENDDTSSEDKESVTKNISNNKNARLEDKNSTESKDGENTLRLRSRTRKGLTKLVIDESTTGELRGKRRSKKRQENVDNVGSRLTENSFFTNEVDESECNLYSPKILRSLLEEDARKIKEKHLETYDQLKLNDNSFEIAPDEKLDVSTEKEHETNNKNHITENEENKINEASVNVERSKENKNLVDSDRVAVISDENSEEKADLLRASTGGDYTEFQETSKNISTKPDKTENVSPTSKKRKSIGQNMEINSGTEVSFEKRKINIQGIIIEEVDKFDTDENSRAESDSDSDLRENEESPNERTELERMEDNDCVDEDTVFMNEKPTKSTLDEVRTNENDVREEEETIQCVETETDNTGNVTFNSESVSTVEYFKSKFSDKEMNESDKGEENQFDREDTCIANKEEAKEDMPDSENEDSDSSPEEETFQSSRNKALCSLKDAEEEARKVKLQAKKLRRKYHERNIMQKEEKKRRMLEPKEPKFSKDAEYSNVSSRHTEEFISVHGNTEFRVYKVENYTKKQSSSIEAAKEWKRNLLFGSKNKRESVKEMMAKRTKQWVSGKL